MVIYNGIRFPPTTMHTYQRVAESSNSYAAKQTTLKRLEDDFSSGRPKGFVTALLTPAIGKAIENVEKARMRHTTALVAIAATEFRITHDKKSAQVFIHRFSV